MGFTPVELRHLGFGRRLLGYKRASVDRTLAEIADSFEDVWRDRADLADKVEQLEHDLVRYRELETLLRTTLVSAERAAHDLKDQARREAALIVGEAQSEARTITRAARADFDRLDAETRRIRSLLRAALETVSEGAGPESEATPEAGTGAAPDERPAAEAPASAPPEPVDEDTGERRRDRWEAA